MRSFVWLVAFALVASLILVSAAVAQEEVVGEQYEQQLEEKGVPPMIAEQAGEQVEQKLEMFQESPAEEKIEEPVEEKMEQKMEKMEEKPDVKEKGKEVPKTGGPALGSLLLPAAVLLVGSGILAFATLRRR